MEVDMLLKKYVSINKISVFCLLLSFSHWIPWVLLSTLQKGFKKRVWISIGPNLYLADMKIKNKQTNQNEYSAIRKIQFKSVSIMNISKVVMPFSMFSCLCLPNFPVWIFNSLLTLTGPKPFPWMSKISIHKFFWSS